MAQGRAISRALVFVCEIIWYSVELVTIIIMYKFDRLSVCQLNCSINIVRVKRKAWAKKHGDGFVASIIS